MSWLRIDDNFTSHPKFVGWTTAQRWGWLEVMSYCARYDTAGIVPSDLSLMPRSVTRSLLNRAEKVGLMDRTTEGEMVIHDWPIYNGSSVADKVAYVLGKTPGASANEVLRQIGGKRDIVLAEVDRYRSGTREPEGNRYPGTGKGGSQSGSETGTRARAPRPLAPAPRKARVEGSPTTPLSREEQAETNETVRAVIAILGQVTKPGYSPAKLTAARLADLLPRFDGISVTDEAEKLRDWELYGGGEGKPTKDGVARLRTWLTKAAADAVVIDPDEIGAPPWLPKGMTF